MNYCCQRQQSTETESSGRANQTLMKSTNSKLKYSFRTLQATMYTSNKQTNTNYNTNMNAVTQSQLPSSIYQPAESKLLSTVVSTNELIELEKQRQSLINEDRQLDAFYHHRIVPLEKEVQFFQHQVKVRSIQIAELEGLLGKRVQEKMLEGKRNVSEQYQPQVDSVQAQQVNSSQPVIRTVRPQQPSQQLILSPQSPRIMPLQQHIILAPQPQPIIVTSPFSPRQSVVVSQFIMKPQPQPLVRN